MNHYTHWYGSTVINASRISSMVNLMLEARVRYLLYIIIYCERVLYTTDLLVWGLLRLTPNIYGCTHLFAHTNYSYTVMSTFSNMM